MNAPSIEVVATTTEATELDELLWSVLWQPLGLPRTFRHELGVGGEQLELVAKADGQIVGGLVAVWTAPGEVELRHLAVVPDAQGRGAGANLVADLLRRVTRKGCRRIRTIARSTSIGFFKNLGFRSVPGEAPEHTAFTRHGIRFAVMEMIVDQGGARQSDSERRRAKEG